MSAESVPFRSRAERAMLRSFNQMPPRGQRALLDALYRIVDEGQPFSDSMIQMHVELGCTRSEARRRAREVKAGSRHPKNGDNGGSAA